MKSTKAPPPKTNAWYEIVNANRPTGEFEMRDVLESLGNPDAVTIARIKLKAPEKLKWLDDPKHSRYIAGRMQACGYVTVRNPDGKSDGRWFVNEAGIVARKTPVFAKETLPPKAQTEAIQALSAAKPKGHIC